jgi:hypothetical protein
MLTVFRHVRWKRSKDAMKNALLCALIVAASTSLASADVQHLNVRGTVVSFAANVLTVDSPNGTEKIPLAPDARVTLVVKANLADIAAGSYVGTAAVPQADGTLRALEVHIFPPGQTPGAGSRPYDLTPTSSMTNGSVTNMATSRVDNVDARTLTVTYQGGEKQVVVPASAPVVSFEPGQRSALIAGAHVVVGVTKADDGTLTGVRVNVGKDGLTPPM